MKDYDIANIAKDYRNRSVDACREMMILWLQTVPSPTWGKLDDAISLLMNTLTTKPYGMLYIAAYVQCNYTLVLSDILVNIVIVINLLNRFS